MRISRAVQIAVAVAVVSLGSVQAYAHQVHTIPTVADSDRPFVGNGDCNISGGVTTADALVAAMYLSGARVPSTSEFLRCDANWNGRLDQGDVAMINKAAVGTMKLPIAKYLKGDANGDGRVIASDALLTASYLEHTTETLTPIVGIIGVIIDYLTAMRKTRIYNADCNTDGVIDNKDVKGTLNLSIGLACQ